MSTKKRKVCMPPIIDADARVLILGTLPGDESLRLQEYYGHPRNHFWPVVAGAICEALPDAYADRAAMLSRHRIALWDVLASAERLGSLDASIRGGAPNAIPTLLDGHPSLRTIAFNGQGAAALFRRHFSRSGLVAANRVTTILLPSTSPAFTQPLQAKALAWRNGLRVALEA